MNDHITIHRAPQPITQTSQESEQIFSQGNMIGKQVRWLAAWVVLNIIGFSLGEMLGGRTGLLKVFSEWSGIHSGGLWVAGCLPYGFAFGFCSRLALQPGWRNNAGMPWLQRWAWPMACAIGYAVGIGVGEKLSFAVAPVPALLGVTFGVFVGLFLGIAQALALRNRCGSAWQWVLSCMLVWIIGEAVAFALGFEFRNTPVVGAVIGAASGVFMLRLCPRMVTSA